MVSRCLIAAAPRTYQEMTFPLLEYYLRCKTVSALRECVRLAGASPNPRGRKDDLIDALLQVCRTASVHERLWDLLLTHVSKREIKVVIARRPPPGLRSTWGSNKASLIATVIRADRPEAAQAQDDTPGSSASSQVPACGVLVPADCSPEVLKARLRRTWIKKARRRLKHSAIKGATIHTYADGFANYPRGKSSSDSGRGATPGRRSNFPVFRERREIQILCAPPSPPDGERKRSTEAPSSS